MALPSISLPSPTPKGLAKAASEPTLSKDGPQRKKGSAAARAAFLERQFKHQSIGSRKSVAVLHKQLIRDGRDADDVEFWGAKGKEGFRQYLITRFGSVVAGWRALDRDKNGRLSFFELTLACRAMGYHGNFKKLWDELDVNRNNFVSIMEIDQEVGHYVGTYKLALMKKHGDMLTAWQKGIDLNKTGRIEEKEITASLADLGLTELDPKKLFKMLVSGPKGLGLTLAEFDPDAWNRFRSGDHKGLTMKANKDLIDETQFAEHGTPQDITVHEGGVDGGARAFRRQLEQRDRQEHFEELQRVTPCKVGIHTVEGLQKALTIRFGSLMKAWREGLDSDGNGRLTIGEFIVAFNRLGFFGDIQGLWKELDKKKSGFLFFAALDPDTDAIMTELRKKFEDAFGNMLLAWLKALDVKGSGLVSMEQFQKACKAAGYAGDAKAVFKLLVQKDRTFLTLKDFDVRAHLALSRGDFRMLSESDSPAYGGKSPLELTFDERQEAGFFYQVRRSWEAAKREEFARACRLDVPEHVIDTVEEFELLCRRQFGSMTAAWRLCLDMDVNGKLTFNEFCKSLRRLGYAGDFKALWKHYDADKSGHISLKEIDPAGHMRITKFLDLLNGRYGDLDRAWKFGFNKDPHDSIDLQELTEACASLKFEGEPSELFKDLSPVPGRVLLTIWDIDPECTRKRARGQVAYISEPRGAELRTEPRPMFGEQEGKSSASTFRSGASQETVGPADLMRQCLRRAHGTTVAAWRAELDPNMHGSISFGKFQIIMDNCHFSGKIKLLWEELTGGKSSATFADIDPDAARTLGKFRKQLLDKFGTLIRAWDNGLDVDALGRVDEAEFLKSVGAMGIDAKRGRRLFKLMLARQGQRSMVCEDLQALLIGVVPDDAAVVWAGGPPAAGRSPGLASTEFPSPPASPKSPPLVASPKVHAETVSPRVHAETITKAHHKQDIIITSVGDFRKKLVVKYGSLFNAWRRGLDTDNNGVLTQSDFARACQFLGVKAVQQLWSELDVKKVGQITLKDVDAEVAELFAELERLLMQKFGSDMKTGWRQTFDPDNKLRCDLTNWTAGCVKLGFKGKGKNSAERLFRLVKPEPGRSYLAFDDLWPDKDPNGFGPGAWSHPASPK